MKLNVWTCDGCGAVNAGGRKRCGCGAVKGSKATLAESSPSGEPAPAKVPEKDWPKVDQHGLKIARRFGIRKM